MKLYKSLLIIAILALTQACTDEFEEINSNPNQPETVGGNLLLPTIIIDPAQNFLGGVAWEEGNTAMQISAVNNFTTFDQMGWGDLGGTWNTMYRGLRDTQNLIEIAQENDQPAYRGVALVMRAWMGHVLTDLYGDIPFSEAVSAKDGNLTPAYDTQESVFNTILADLEAADDILAQGGAIDGDLLFEGDLVKWRKFANSLRIRILMRLENKRGGNTIGASIQNILDTKPVFESNEDNASIQYLSTAPNQYFQHTGRVGGFDEHRMSLKADTIMKRLDDPRMFVYYRPVGNPDTLAFYFGESDLAAITAASGTGKTAFKDFLLSRYNNDPERVKQYYPSFKGLPNGLSEGNAIDFNGSRQNQSRLGEILRELPNGVAMNFMTYAELSFILAEASQKGYINGDVEEYYLNGINAAFDVYGITPHPTYFEQPGVVLSTDNDDVLYKIAVQKWMALFHSGMEAYFDWRRTGIPAIVPGQDNVNGDRVPLRFNYPGQEQSLNPTNWQTAVDRIGGDDNINAVMWLLQ